MNTNNHNDHNNAITALKGPTPITVFNGIYNPTTTNQYIYNTSFQPPLNNIMKGGTASYLCYGYTGAGNHQGVFQLAARDIFNQISILNEQRKHEIQ